MKQRITQKLLDEIQPGNTDLYISDEGVSGFRLKLTPAGGKILFFQYRDAEGRQRKILFDKGKSVAEARKLANEALVKLQNDEDPQAERNRRSTMPTLGRAFELFEAEYVPDECRPVTAHEYHRMFDKYVSDDLKRRLVCDVARRDMVELMRSMRGTPTQANNIVKMLSAFFNWCAGDGALLAAGTNPTLGVRRNPDRKRSFVFEGAQLYRFSRTLDEAEKTEWPFAVAAVRLLLMAGMRKQEVLRLTWPEVDLPGRRIRLKASKTGKRDVPLGKAAIAILEDLQSKRRAFPSEYVFPSPRDRSKPIVGFQKIWHRIRIAADMPELRVHDLRHNYGGFGAAATRSAVHVKGLLGHTQIGTTDR